MATRRRPRRKKSSGGSYIILILLAVIAVLAVSCGLFYASNRSNKDVAVQGSANKVEKIDLLDESTEAHRLIDNILLQKANWQLIEKSHETKEVTVEKSGAEIQINQRDLAVGIPASTSLTGAGEWLEEKINASGLVFISGAMGTYKTWDAYIAKLGIKVKAGAGQQALMTDSVVFYHNLNLKTEDKDVKPLPETKEAAGDKPKQHKYSGKVAIIVDDCGYDLKTVRTLLNTGLPFSYAILPDKPFSSDVLEIVRNKGLVPMLHLPMEPVDRSAMSEGASTILTELSDSKKTELVKKALNGLTGIAGVNNHQGSRATSDRQTMRVVLKELKKHGLFFVDSRTSSASVARDVAREMGVKTARNDIFLDNSTNIETIRQQIYKAFAMAEKNGSAIAICHARPNTVRCWEQYVDEFKAAGVEFVPVTEVLY